MTVFTCGCFDTEDGFGWGYVSFPLVVNGVFDLPGGVGEAVKGSIFPVVVEISVGPGSDPFLHLALPATVARSAPANHLCVRDNFVLSH